MSATPLSVPSRYAPIYAVGFSSQDGELRTVTTLAPLPVTVGQAAPPPPLVVAVDADGVVGPFVPDRGIAVTLTLDGEWSGTARVMRSTDGGLTRQPLTVAGEPWAVFGGNACEPVWEENDPAAALYVEFTDISGTLSCRLGH